MRIVMISDTHNKHNELEELPTGDVLIHAGDATWLGSVKEVTEFGDWLGAQKQFKHKIFVPGNHDLGFEDAEEAARELMSKDVHVLINQSVHIDGYHFYGNPWTPKHSRKFKWAFKYEREDSNKIWKDTPEGVDVLITHGPAFEYRDAVRNSKPAGCRGLLHRVLALKPKLHVCGHLHAGYGIEMNDNTIFVNASMCDDDYATGRPAIVVDI